jgi:3-isopropylmalate/(R)-2-methylmalate dehydratase small subunit
MNSLIQGRIWKYGDHVNTDVIFPGKYTYTLLDPAEMAQHALEDFDADFSQGVQPGDVIVAGLNWGCGSSREQAVTCLKAAGIEAIIAVSFARIYYRNALNAGLPAIVSPAAVEAAAAGEQITVDLDKHLILSSKGEIPFMPFPASIHAMLKAGGLIPHLQQTLGGA